MADASDDRLRRMRPEDRREYQALLDTYSAALGLG